MTIQLETDLPPFVHDEKTIVEYIRRFGGSASNGILNPGTKIFSIPTVDGFIGYLLKSNCAIVYGEPICQVPDQQRLMSAFHTFCKDQEVRVIYLIVSESFTKQYLHDSPILIVEFGKELWLDPQNDPRKGAKGHLLRNRVKRAVNAGLSFHEYTDTSPSLEKEIGEVADAWLKGRKGIQIYVGHVNLFKDRFGKRWFYARQGDKIVGVLVLNELQARKGWLLDHLMPIPDEPKGTSEYLVTSVCEKLAQEQCHFFSFGAVLDADNGEVIGSGRYLTWFIRRAFKAADLIFKLDGRKRFWKKFQPVSDRAYVIFNKPSIGINDIVALLQSLNVSL